MTEINAPQAFATEGQISRSEPPAWLMRRQASDDIHHPGDINGIQPEGFVSYYGRRALWLMIETAGFIAKCAVTLLYWMVFGLISSIAR